MRVKYKLRPAVVEAIIFDGEDIDSVVAFVGRDRLVSILNGVAVSVRTPNGNSMISKGDYITKDSKGQVNVYIASDFHAKYERHLIWDENI